MYALGTRNNEIQMQAAGVGVLLREARLTLLDRLLPPVPPWAWPAGRKPQGRARKLKRDLISLYARGTPGDPPQEELESVAVGGKTAALFAVLQTSI